MTIGSASVGAGNATAATMTETATPDAPRMDTGAPGKVRVWDPLARLFHWSLVAAFTVAWLTAEELFTVHEIAGYVVAGLAALRLFWGLVGSRYARFTQFMKGPRVTLSYLGDMARGKERRYLGHNPAGAAMTVALLLTLSGVAISGWMMAEPGRVAMPPEWPQAVSSAFADEAAAYKDHDEGRAEALEEVHEVLANLMLFLIAAHVAGVMLTSFRHHENLARAMITGDKRAPGPGDIS